MGYEADGVSDPSATTPKLKRIHVQTILKQEGVGWGGVGEEHDKIQSL